MRIHEFPSRSQNHVDAFSWVIYEVTEDHGQAFKRISFDVKELVGIWLDNLQEHSHPLVERVVQASAYELIVNTISPTYSSKTKIENVQNLVSSMVSDFFMGKSAKNGR